MKAYTQSESIMLLGKKIINASKTNSEKPYNYIIQLAFLAKKKNLQRCLPVIK